MSELQQIRGLCERQDREAFQPFSTDFLGGDVGQHVLDLDGLLIEAVDGLVADGLSSTRGLKWSAGQGWFGRYFRLGGWVCLHVNYTRWGKERPTPMWLRIIDQDAGPDVLEALAPLALEDPPRFLNEDGLRQIPIQLPHDDSRDVVHAAIDGQLRQVHALLQSCSLPLPQREPPR